MLAWVFLSPALVGAVAFIVPYNRIRPYLVPLGGGLHLALTWNAIGAGATSSWNGWLVLDPLSKLFLSFVSVFFLICGLYAPGYLRLRSERPNRILCACMLLSLSMMTLVILSHHLGLLWIAIEASTLMTAPSLYFNHNARSLEATWKYLLICSVGVALALLGSFFLAYSALHAGLESSLLFEGLVEQAPRLSRPWLHAAYVLLMVGYGTKMGLAPMHTWKPDAYGEAPGMIGAMMAGGMTSCAFLAILRIYHIANAAHDADHVQRIMLLFGLLSMGTAAVFLVRQRDIKRLLAYSSVEHMGMLMFGMGIGGLGVVSSLLHVVHNGFTKGVLFLAAANIHRAYGSKFTGDLQGVLRRLPFSGAMFVAGFFAITGAPPFAPFVSEFQMLTAAFQQQRYVSAGLFLFFLMFVFVGFGGTVMSVSFGAHSLEQKNDRGFHDGVGTSLPILVSMLLVILLGVYNPPAFDAAVREAAQFLSATP
jgi:hydrogenase-4 component F